MPEQDLKLDPRIGPFVTALLCERIIEERDGVKTLVRIIDQVNRQAAGQDPPSVMDPFPYTVGLLVRLKAGAARGTFQIHVKIRKPSNTLAVELSHAIHLPGPDDAGADLAFNLMMLLDEVGTWWFDVYVGEDKWMRIPLRVVYLPQQVSRIGGGLLGR